MEQTHHTQDWIEYIVDNVRQYYKGRKIVLWGKYIESDNIRNKLKEKYDIDAAFYVDSNPEKIDNREIFSTECLNGKSTEYYIVIPLVVYQSIRDVLFKGGYKADVDYFYFSDCVLREEEDYYEDAHGNKIIGNVCMGGGKICFSGFNSVVEIGNNVRLQKSNFYIHNNARIIIGNNTEFINANLYMENRANIVLGDSICVINSSIHLLDNAECEIGCKCRLKHFGMKFGEYTKVLIGKEVELRGTNEHKGSWTMLHKSRLEIGDRGLFKYGNLYLEENSILRVGKDFTIEINYRVNSDRDTAILIGDDCMFSFDIILKSNDGHSIFDIRTAKNLNTSYATREYRKIDIGNHVWIGMRAIILYDTQIKDGSIIGAMSIVKSEIPNNSIAAGVPARIVRRDIAWSREIATENILTCGEEYVRMTEEI